MAKTAGVRASDYQVVYDGPAASVRLAPKACRQYRQAIAGNDKISMQRRTHLARYFDAFCTDADVYKRLNDQQLKREGTFKDGQGANVAIWAFKAPKWRVYGAILVVNGKRCFVGTRVDGNKKQDRADQSLLKATGKDIGELFEYRQAKGS